MKILYKSILNEKEKIIRDLKLNEDDLIYISGSLVEGYGNKYSDLDIFIIVQNIENIKLSNYDYDEKNLKTIFREYANKKCDIEIYQLDIIKNNIEILNTIDFSNIRVMNIFKGINGVKFLSFLHRLLVGEALNNEKKFENLKQQINKDKYYQLLKLFYQNQIENGYDDLIGNMEEKNYITTILIGNTIITSLMSYYLASKNISIDRGKWSYIKLFQLSKLSYEEKEMLEKFEKFILVKVDKRKYAKELINFIDKILG